MLFLTLALVMSVGGLSAGIITFDSVTPGATVPSAMDSGVTVTFFAGSGSCNPPGTCPGTLSSVYGAAPGNGTQEGFTPDDTRAGGPQTNLITDEDSSVAGNVQALDYFFSFDIGVPDLQLDLLDFRADGGALAGATAVLDVFSASDWSGGPLFSTSYVTTGLEADGNVVTLVVPGGLGPIFSARVSFTPSLSGGTADNGTGIDNLEWTTPIPEPGTVVLFGSGLLALAAFARKRRQA
jgi:hypothetical protein